MRALTKTCEDSPFCFSPRVIGVERPDFYSLETLLASPPFAGKQGEDLALAIYDYFTSQVDGTYHFWSPEENLGEPRLRGRVCDPLKHLNAYGWMLCGDHATLLYALYTTAGLRARQFGWPGHCLCEVYYEGAWHFLDIDMWTWFRNPSGQIAGAYELSKHSKALILDNLNKSHPCNLPDRSLAEYAAMTAAAPVIDAEQRVKGIWPPATSRRHSMDFQLRPGETLVRSQVAGGRFPFPASWKPLLTSVAAEWHGCPTERYAPSRTYGNGRWIYAPNLSSAFADFTLGVWMREGLRQDEAGVTGGGTATLRIQSPYPFCGVPDLSGDRIRHRDGVWLEVAGAGPATFEVNTAEGAWEPVFKAAGPCLFHQRLDITHLLAERYDCLIRFTLGETARLNALSFDGFILTAPISLPRLVEGPNRMELRCLDKHHLCTVPWNHIVDFRASAEMAAQVVSIDNGIAQPASKGWQKLAPRETSLPVRAVFRIEPPASRRYAWFRVHATVDEVPAGEAARRALLEWSHDSRTWSPFAVQTVVSSDLGWDMNVDGEVLLAPDNAATVWLRLTSDTAIGGLEFYGHLDAGSGNSSELRLVHRWTEGGQPREFKVPTDHSVVYEVPCGKEPTGHTIEMSLPSKRASRGHPHPVHVKDVGKDQPTRGEGMDFAPQVFSLSPFRHGRI